MGGIPYLFDASFEDISEIEFNKPVTIHMCEIIMKPDLPLNKSGKFIGVLLMYSIKTEFFVLLLAECEDEYLHFYWQTTA